MSTHSQSRTSLLLLAISPLLASSCSQRDPLVDEMIRQQANHHQTVARQSEELTKASKELVESEAKARREQAEHEAQLQARRESERQNLEAQRETIEAERREIAKQRYRDPLISASIIQATTLVIAVLPIVLLILLVRLARTESDDVPLGELLTHELVTERPLLLPGPVLAATRPGITMRDDDESPPLIDESPAGG